jgi:hypothetical protein
MLEVRSDSFRLIELGTYDGTPGTFEATIRQVPWHHGSAGVFFGYRVQPKGLKPKVATFQLFSLSYLQNFDPKAGFQGHELGLRRDRAQIDIDPVQFWEEVSASQALPKVNGQQVRLRIEFGERRCLAVYVDGQRLERLATDELNAGFEEADYRGPFGLYHEGGPGNQDPTWFGDVSYTPATK